MAFIRYRHCELINGNILTICMQLNKKEKKVNIGWSVYNKSDTKLIKYDRKYGNNQAKNRLDKCNLYFYLDSKKQIQSDYITLHCLLLLYINNIKPYGWDDDIDHPYQITKKTRYCIFEEIQKIMLLVQKRKIKG